MKIEVNKCIKQTHNANMGTECWSDDTTVFYIDRNNWVKVGDEVKCERDEKGFYRKVWVNGKRKTNDSFRDIHGKD